jgi:CheY-like chemotaxis protein
VSTSPSVDTDMMAAENALHILLVDDTPSILKICTRTLLREGYRVSTAENGFEALKLLTAASFDAVLMDLQMPVLDGLETVRRFRANEQVVPGKRRQFIVAVSANSDPAVAKGVIECGFDGFIEKPFTVKRLQAILPADL